MKKIYNLGYEKGHYFLEYNMPKNKEGKLLIDEKKMELDSGKFYKMLFEQTTEEIEISICNKIGTDVNDNIQKKGIRVAETLQLLCDEICKEINKKCFKDKLLRND